MPYSADRIFYRRNTDSGWQSYVELYHTGNIPTWNQNTTGTAAYATQWGTAAGYANFSSTAISASVGWLFGTTGNGTYAPVSLASVSSLLGLGSMASASTSSYVPYSGASGSVDLGSYTLTATSLVATSSGSGKIRIIADYAQNYIESYDSTLSNWSKLVIIAGGHSFRTNSNVILFDIDSSGNVGVGQSASSSFKFNVLGTGKFSGQLTLGSTIM
jgi:hypothetical protein